MIKPDGMRESAATYLAGADPRHPYASPLYADLLGLPPILIQVGDAEVILDDSARFAAKARGAMANSLTSAVSDRGRGAADAAFATLWT